ncbi:hypothetical protein ACH5RR_013900 [Cinchona calisaya]|uniref:Legume lectin domain-containing protein n=1 Tax=Cinchona calisaya TaxID=153742 RepID=A0ABD3A765_9GENT
MATKFTKIAFLITCFFQFLFLAKAISFQISRFSPDLSTILYRGDATASVGTIEFNNVNYLCRVGQVIYSETVPIWDSHSGKVTDFTTHFSFIIDTQNQTHYGHGISFFLAPVGFQIPPNSAGGFLGLYNTSTINSSHDQMISVEFDSFSNPEWDPPYEHVGINNNSIASAVTTPWNVSLHSGETADAWIVYNSSTKNLSVSWSYGSSSSYSSLSHQIDLKQILPQWVIIGFSSATGEYVESHVLESWDFSSSLDIKKKSGNKAKEIGLILGLTVAGVVLIAGGIIAFVVIRRKIQPAKGNLESANLTTSMNDDFERGTGPKRFSYKDLVSATNNFSNDRKLGQGGFGGVYKVDRMPTDQKPESGLVEWVWDLYGLEELSSAVDKKLNNEFDLKQVECLLIVGLWCAHPDCNLRPSIKLAIQVLNFEAALPKLPNKMPVPIYDAPVANSSSAEPLITCTSIDVGR